MSEKAPKRFTDGSTAFDAGVDAGRSPSMLPPNAVAFAVNCSFEGGYISPRPGFQYQEYTYGSSSGVFDGPLPAGNFQCAHSYISDDGRLFIVLLISGNTWLYDIVQKRMTLLSEDASLANAANIAEGWMVQAENFLVIQDGQSRPLIFNGSSLRRAALDEIKTGKVMAYVSGRIWYALQDGFSFRATDIVYGDGTRASVLKETESTFLNEGGNFAVPSDSGGITAMAVPGTLDTALGQGPLLVMTPKYIFSINAPVDREVWKNLNYPIQSISQVSNGAVASRSAITVNGDVFYRAVDGVRSFIIARRDFGTWGNTPISNELTNIISNDQVDLLWASSAIYFANRLLMTCQPRWRNVAYPQWANTGVYHEAIAVLEFEPVTGMRQKSPPAWAGVWTGINVLQLLRCENAYGERAFAIVKNDTNGIEIWEITKSAIADTNADGEKSIEWFFETKSYNYESTFGLKRLETGDIFIDNLQGTAEFAAWYRPDQYPAWVSWHSWSVCSNPNSCAVSFDCPVPTLAQPQYRPKMRLPTPADACNTSVGVQFRNMFETQLRVSVAGYCRIRSVRLHAYDIPEPIVGQCLPDPGTCTALNDCNLSIFSYTSDAS